MQPPTGLIPFTLSEVFEFSRQLMTTRYVAFSGVVLLIYDWMLTFDEEVNSLWPAKLSTTKVIFLLNRYVNIASQIAMIVHFIGLAEANSRVTCVFFVVGYGATVFLALASVHVLVLLRAWVIWNRRPWITISLALAYILYALTCVALITYATITDANSFIFNINGTCVSFTAPTLWYVWVASLALEYVSFSFTLASISCHHMGVTPGFSGLQPLVRRVYLSGLAYIIFSTACHISNMVLWSVFWNTPYNMIAVTFTCCLMNVAGQRFVLDLRRVNEERLTPSLPALSSIDTQDIELEFLTHNDRLVH